MATRSTHSRTHIALLLAIAPLVVAEPVHAGSCDSAAKIAVDLWDEYGKQAMQLGCSVATTATVAASSGASGDPETTREACLDNAEKREQLARQMIATWNRLAANRWATIGPRQLPLDAVQQGTIIGPGTRLFLTPVPVDADAIDVTFTKEAFRGPGEVTVCSHAPDGTRARRWNFTVARGDDNTGKVWLRRIDGVKGRLVSVHIVGQSVAKKLRYRLEVDPAAATPRTHPPAGTSEGPRATDPVAERQGPVVDTCEGTVPASSAALRSGAAAARIARPMPMPVGATHPTPPRALDALRTPAARGVVAFSPAGGWVLARGTQFVAEGVPDEALQKLQAYGDAGKVIDAVAFTPEGGWTIATDGASWTRNVGGRYHDAVTALVADGTRVRSVAFNPAGWRERHGFVLAHESGFVAEHIPTEMCAKLQAYTRAGAVLDAVAFTPDGGWTIVAGDASWTRNVGGPAPSFHDTVTAALARGADVHGVAFDPAGYGTNHAWIVLSGGGFHASRIPDDAEARLTETFGLRRIPAGQ